jgi:hypothetical protein
MQQWIVQSKDDENIQMPEFLAALNVKVREIPGIVTIINQCGRVVTFPKLGKGGVCGSKC